MSRAAPADRSGITEALAVWSVLAVVGIELLVTYSRTPIRELFHVRSGGLGAGVSRVLAFVGFPVGLIALAIVAIVSDRVPQRSILVGAGAGIALAAAILSPGRSRWRSQRASSRSTSCSGTDSPGARRRSRSRRFGQSSQV